MPFTRLTTINNPTFLENCTVKKIKKGAKTNTSDSENNIENC